MLSEKHVVYFARESYKKKRSRRNQKALRMSRVFPVYLDAAFVRENLRQAAAL